jgi:SPX domain protein involved in polyphosphate accumulation
MIETQIHDRRIELKYVLDAKLSSDVRAWAREHLGVDSHCNASLDDSYDVTTLYLDTPELDLFHRTGTIGSTKHRVRRYGDETILWIETKSKKKNVVQKDRTATSEDECVTHLSDLENDSPWCGDWFTGRIIERRLQPTVQVHYRRFARMSTLGGESMRLTIDSQLQSSPANGWNIASTSEHSDPSQRLSAASAEVLELKFHRRMPHLFKELLREFPIPLASFSKYRTACVAACPSLRDSPKDLSRNPIQQISEESVHA